MDKHVNQSARNLQILASLIKNVYLPLENKDMKSVLTKFVAEISHSLQQIAGSITINLPDP